jgi:hypothetical protein
MRFNPDLLELVPKEQLDADFGGDYEFEFDAESYWQQVVSYVILLPVRLRILGVDLFSYLGLCRHCAIAPDGTRVQKDEVTSPVEGLTPTEDGAIPNGAPNGSACVFHPYSKYDLILNYFYE